MAKVTKKNTTLEVAEESKETSVINQYSNVVGLKNYNDKKIVSANEKIVNNRKYIKVMIETGETFLLETGNLKNFLK